jgi:hypothetical protein
MSDDFRREGAVCLIEMKTQSGIASIDINNVSAVVLRVDDYESDYRETNCGLDIHMKSGTIFVSTEDAHARYSAWVKIGEAISHRGNER